MVTLILIMIYLVGFSIWFGDIIKLRGKNFNYTKYIISTILFLLCPIIIPIVIGIIINQKLNELNL